MSNLCVRVAAAGESYALPVDAVLEVAELEGITPVPGATPTVLGVRNLRGAVLPVVDLAGVLGLPRADGPRRIVVAAEGGRIAGLAVDSVAGVESLPDASEPADSPYLSGAALTDGVLVGLVDLSSVLDAAQGEVAA
jgi:chemotaxis signal transduction protein